MIDSVKFRLLTSQEDEWNSFLSFSCLWQRYAYQVEFLLPHACHKHVHYASPFVFSVPPYGITKSRANSPLSWFFGSDLFRFSDLWAWVPVSQSIYRYMWKTLLQWHNKFRKNLVQDRSLKKGQKCWSFFINLPLSFALFGFCSVFLFACLSFAFKITNVFSLFTIK